MFDFKKVWVQLLYMCQNLDKCLNVIIKLVYQCVYIKHNVITYMFYKLDVKENKKMCNTSYL